MLELIISVLAQKTELSMRLCISTDPIVVLHAKLYSVKTHHKGWFITACFLFQNNSPSQNFNSSSLLKSQVDTLLEAGGPGDRLGGIASYSSDISSQRTCDNLLACISSLGVFELGYTYVSMSAPNSYNRVPSPLWSEPGSCAIASPVLYHWANLISSSLAKPGMTTF